MFERFSGDYDLDFQFYRAFLIPRNDEIRFDTLGYLNARDTYQGDALSVCIWCESDKNSRKISLQFRFSIRIGRKYTLITALFFNAFFAILCGLSQTFELLLFFRFLSGLGFVNLFV